MLRFTYDQPPARVIFGVGCLDHLTDEVGRLGSERALILSTPEQKADAENVAARLGPLAAGIFARAVMHVPIETARDARRLAKDRGADCCVAVGGGSTIGLGKAIALEGGLPIIAIPTTYAGSEMTPIYGLTEGGIKKTGRDPRVRPRTVLYDPSLTLTLPPHVSGPSGMNAIAHCVEGLYARDTNPVMTLLAREGIRALAHSLPIVVRAPANLEARTESVYGAWLAGMVLGSVGMALHHKLCHTLGGTFNLPHAEVHTVILPHALAYNRGAAAEAMHIAAEALGCADAAQGLYDLAVSLKAPVALKDIGMPADQLDLAAKLATENPYDNPRPVEYAGIRRLLDDAFHGTRPAPG